MFESPIESERPSSEPHHVPPGGLPLSEEAKGVGGVIDLAASKAREVVTGAKDTVVSTVSTQGDFALGKVKEGAQTVQSTAKEYFYILAVVCLALGFVVGLLFSMNRSDRRIVVHKDWRPWS